MDDNTLPTPAPSLFTGASREVDAGACFDWLRAGWATFIANPGVWIGATILLLVMLVAINVVPVFGQIAGNLLLPVFGGGLVLMCHHQHAGRQAEIADLFAGFRHNAGALVMVGVFYVTGIFGVAFVCTLLVSSGVIAGAITGSVAGFSIALSAAMLAGVVAFLLTIPVFMAVWFAPFMVFLHDMETVPAMKASFAAGAKNPVPMLVFGLILIVAAFFAILPALLGLLLLIPVFSGAAYASYRDIFTEI